MTVHDGTADGPKIAKRPRNDILTFLALLLIFACCMCFFV
jgi:hypothetical protein